MTIKTNEKQNTFDRITILLSTLVGEIENLSDDELKYMEEALAYSIEDDKIELKKMFSHWHNAIRISFEPQPEDEKQFSHRIYSARVPLKGADVSLRSLKSPEENDIYLDVVISERPKFPQIKALAIKFLAKIKGSKRGSNLPTKWEKIVEFALDRKSKGLNFTAQDLGHLFPDAKGNKLSRRVSSKISQLNKYHLKDYDLAIVSTMAYSLESVEDD